MIRLLKVELGRLTSRRLFRLVAILGLLGVLVVDGLLAANSSKNVAAAQARATSQLQRDYQGCLRDSRTVNGPPKAACDGMTPAGQLKECLAQVGNSNGPTEQDCRRDAARNPYFNDPRFHFAKHAKDLLTGAAFILMALALLVGASAIGAEWQAGTFGSLLTWEPRRQRVLATKLLAPVMGMVVVSALAMAVLVSGAVLAANARGTMDGTTSQLVGQLLVMATRVLALTALASLVGGALATLTRSTIGVVGIVAGYLVAGELVGSIVSKWWRYHGLAAHLVAIVAGKLAFDLPHRTATGTTYVTHHLHAAGGAVLLSVIAVTIVVLASIVLSRRDVA